MKQEIETWLESLPTKQRKKIEDRWEEWRPTIELQIGSQGAVLILLRAHYLTFLIRVRRLLEAQLRWYTIRMNRLDNPLATDGEFASGLANGIAARKKGITIWKLRHNRKLRTYEVHS